LIALTLSAFHHKVMHVVIVFFLVEYGMCSYLLLFILHLHNPAIAQTDALKISLEKSMSSGRTLPQSAVCSGRPCLLSAVFTLVV
jgi:hypothetical protein